MNRRTFSAPALLCMCALLCTCGSSLEEALPGLYGYDAFAVVSCSPSNNERGVSADGGILVIFNADAERSDVEGNFSLSYNSVRVEGVFAWPSPRTFRFTPRYQLKVAQRYVIEIPRGVRDSLGNPMSADFISDFYVGTSFERPGVVASQPRYSPGGVIIDPDNPLDQNIAAMERIIIDFSTPMDRMKTERAFSISPDCPGYFEASADTRLVYRFTTRPEYGRQYRVRVDSSAEDSSGITLAREFSLVFNVGIDATPPSVAGIHDGTPPFWEREVINRGIEKNACYQIEFSEDMDKASCEDAFSVTPAIEGVFSWVSGSTMIFTPSSPLESEGIYRIAINSGATDLHGLHMDEPYQVRVMIDGERSRHVTVGQVSGSHNDAAYAVLISGEPQSAAWPYLIDMGGGINQRYYITVQFLRAGSPVPMNTYSIFGNCMLEGFGPRDPSVDDPAIGDISWPDQSTVKIMLTGLSNKFIPTPHPPVLYRLTVVGGTGGVRDTLGNTMAHDLVFEFREAE